jgi:hypothetical protein
MDCEKFEAALMDELYGELDELTSAAMKRHASGCARCAALLSGLSATRRLASIATVPVPDGLEERILAAAREADKVVPIQRRVARVVSLAGRWAMRPQTAMAAVFLVMIGTSVLLLSGKASRAPASASITVTEQGSPAGQVMAAASAMPTTAAEPYAAPVALDRGPLPAAPAAIARPEAQREETATRGAPKGFGQPGAAPRDDEGLAMNGPSRYAPAPTAAAAPMAGGGAADLGGVAAAEKRSVSPIAAAIQTYQAGRYDDAARAFDALAPGDPNAALWAARSVRESKGCKAALSRFDQASQKGAGSPPGWDALLEGALCYRALGDYGNARLRLAALLKVDSHKDRAQAELDRMNQAQSGQGGAGAAGAAKAAAPAPAPPPASRPAASGVDTSY